MTILNRRGFASAGLAAAGVAVAGTATAQTRSNGGRGGSIDANAEGLQPGADTDQRLFAKLLNRASDENLVLFLGPGNYFLSEIELPSHTRLHGIAGATRILSARGLTARGAERVELHGITLDGSGGLIAGGAGGLLQLVSVAHMDLRDCGIENSNGYGLSLNGVAGRVANCAIIGAAEAAIYALDSRGLAIADNHVADCGNGGILVHRSSAGEDRTIVSGNRIERTRADHGGTGQFGNGINVFRAGGVGISRNVVSDSAFSAIRSNGGSNVRISDNQCLRSGETAIYSEFIYEGAVIASNLVDGAANGISIVNFNEGGRLAVCSGNLVRNLSRVGPYPADPPGFGVGITVEADTTVSGNVIEGAPLYGMHLGWGPYLRNVIATGNVISDVGEGIAVSVVEGVGPVVISDNVISGARSGAIVGHRWKDAVTGDLAISGADGHPQLSIGRNMTS